MVVLVFASSSRANGRYPAAGQVVADPGDPLHIVVRTTFGLLQTFDGGETWTWICEQMISPNGIQDPELIVTPDGRAALGLPDGLALGDRSGCTWTRAPALAGSNVIDLAQNVADPATAFAAASVTVDGAFNALIAATTNGIAWAPVGAPRPDTYPLTIETAPSQPRRLYLGAQNANLDNGFIDVSDDGGESWSRYASPTGVDSVYVSGVDPTDPDRVFVRSYSPGGRLYVSEDGARSWTLVTSDDLPLTAFALSPDGQLVAVGGQSGLRILKRAPGDGGTGYDLIRDTATPVSCLAWTVAGLYACGDERSAGFTVGLSTDQGATFEPRLELRQVTAAACGSGAACADSWCATATIIGASCGPDAGADVVARAGDAARVAASPGGAGCSCNSSADRMPAEHREASELWLERLLLLPLIGALFIRRPRRRRTFTWATLALAAAIFGGPSGCRSPSMSPDAAGPPPADSAVRDATPASDSDARARDVRPAVDAGLGGSDGQGGRGTGGTSGAGGSLAPPTDGGSDRTPPPPGTTPPITPRWAFEPWVWEDNGNTRASIEGVVKGYTDRQIPVGAVIIDSPWETTYNTLVWDTTRYPSPPAMISQFHAAGVKVIMWTTAFVDTDADVYPTVKQRMYGVNGSADATWWKGTGIHIDITNPAAADWWNARMGTILADGIDGWKLDRGADYIGDPIQTAAGSLSVTDFKKRLSADFFDFTTATNANGLVLVRPYNKAQGGVGSDLAKCSMGWVGDHDGGFAGIVTQKDDIYMSAQLGYGAPGVEVGGYTGAVPSKNSLIRYAQFAALTPLMENGGANGGLTQHLPWTWDTQTVDIYRYFATLHSELGSYNFSYGVEAHLTGLSILRETDATRAQHRLGQDLFASLVTTDVTTKSVVFPAGATWIDYWNEDTTYAGGTTLNYAAPLNQYPLFIRAGAIIPMDVKTAVTGHGDTTSAGKITVLVYPSSSSAGHLLFHRPLGDGTAFSDVSVDADAATGTVWVSGASSVAYRLRVKSLQAPTGVTGADSWSYDANAKVVIADKTGSTFSIMIAGLKGYP